MFILLYLLHWFKNIVRNLILWKCIIKTIYLNIFQNVIYSCDAKLFQKISKNFKEFSVFSVTWSFRNHSNMLIWEFKNTAFIWNTFLVKVFTVTFDPFNVFCWINLLIYLKTKSKYKILVSVNHSAIHFFTVMMIFLKNMLITQLQFSVAQCAIK